MFKGCLNSFLTKEQLDSGISLVEDEDFVYLLHNGKVANFHNIHVTEQILRQEAKDLYIQVSSNNGISFAREHKNV